MRGAALALLAPCVLLLSTLLSSLSPSRTFPHSQHTLLHASRVLLALVLALALFSHAYTNNTHPSLARLAAVEGGEGAEWVRDCKFD